jgi:4-amino-4-deoxy-L-arabinose transferase-like glycosyltransferase
MPPITHPSEKSRKSFPRFAIASQVEPQIPGQISIWPWLEWEAVLLAGIIAAIYFGRLSEMSVRGEESRWATIAMEMIRSGDWIVPQQQGIPFLSRPPLGSWLIAVATLARGQCDVLAVRLPAVLATLLTSLLVYGYSRAFLSRLGAFSAGIAYATMGQVLQLGRVGETEAVFTFFVSASLLVWHWGYSKQWPDIRIWIVGFSLAALGALTKGPQAPIYFVVVTGMFLIMRREWRRLITWSYVAGLAAFVGIIACWQIPFFLKMGWPSVKAIWSSDTAMRLAEIKLPTVLEHMVSYPVEILVCTLPWSLFLLSCLSREVRRSIGSAQPMLTFLAVCLVVAFPSCWLIPGAHGRYFMPLYPCMAPLIGLMMERCLSALPESTPGRIWRHSVAGMCLVMVGFALAVLSASWLGFPKISLLIQERNFSLIYDAITLASIGFLWWSRVRSGSRWGFVGICSLAIYLGLTYDAVVMNFIIRKNGVTGEQVAQLRERLPEGQELTSFGPIHHLFAYHFQDPIALRDWPKNADDVAGRGEYFCFERADARPLPFAWAKIMEISCDRDRTTTPEEVVVVGRRLAEVSNNNQKSSPRITSFRSSP